MKRAEIENHPAWKYISKLSNAERYSALTGNNAVLVERAFNVKIEEWGFTQLAKIPSDWMYISATNSFRNMALIMVLKPN